MSVEVIKDISGYEKFLPVFAGEEYLKYKSNNYGWFKSEKFLLPFYITKRLFFTRLFFTTEVIYLKESDVDNERLFLDEVIEQAKELQTDFIDIPQVNALFNTYPDGAESTLFGTYRIDLSLSVEELFKNLHSKHRNVIRKAEKDGVIIKSGDKYIRDCYDLITETYARQNKKFIPYDNFEKLKISLKDDVSFYVALKGELLQGCAVLIWNKGQSCFYQYGGSISSPSTGAINLLHWKAICDMKTLRVKYYDFFGARINPDKSSKLKGIQRFKERFGGIFVTGFLWKYKIKKHKYLLFKIVVRLYNMVKGIKYEGDIIEQERRRRNSE